MLIDPVFADLRAANTEHAASYGLARLEGTAGKGLAVVTCMDARIDPLGMLGLAPGDAYILRNAGGRVTVDVLGALAVAPYLLGVDRVMVVAHTHCKMAAGDEEHLHAAIGAAGGPDTRSIPLLTTTDLEGSLRTDVQRVRSWPYLGDVTVGGFVYDLETGLLRDVC